MRGWNQELAIELCREIEAVAPDYGYHVGLTGGCLYKNGDRKDLDIIFYRIRQIEKPDRKGMIRALSGIAKATGKASESYGWMTKVYANRGVIDVFFPEDSVGDYIPTADLDPSESNE